MTDHDYQQSVLQRLEGIESWMQHTDERNARIDTRLTAVELIAAVAAEREKNVEARLGTIESGVKFLVGAVIVSLLGFVMSFVIGGGLAP